MICFYVNDLLVTGYNELEIDKFKQNKMSKFETAYLRNISSFLRIYLVTTKHDMFLHQNNYATDELKRFKLKRINEEPTIHATLYWQLIGLLRYLCNSRLDISYSNEIISRFIEEPKISHLIATKWVVIYVKGIIEFVVLFPRGKRKVDR